MNLIVVRSALSDVLSHVAFVVRSLLLLREVILLRLLLLMVIAIDAICLVLLVVLGCNRVLLRRFAQVARVN